MSKLKCQASRACVSPSQNLVSLRVHDRTLILARWRQRTGKLVLYTFTPILFLSTLSLSLESELKQRVASLWSQIRGGMPRKNPRWSREAAEKQRSGITLRWHKSNEFTQGLRNGTDFHGSIYSHEVSTPTHTCSSSIAIKNKHKSENDEDKTKENTKTTFASKLESKAGDKRLKFKSVALRRRRRSAWLGRWKHVRYMYSAFEMTVTARPAANDVFLVVTQTQTLANIFSHTHDATSS